MTVEPSLISLMDRAVLKIQFLNTKGDVAQIPNIDGLKIDYQGPQTQYSLVNGKSSSSVTHTYLVTPTKVGDYTIGPVQIKFKGGEKTLSTKLRVITAKDDPQSQKLSEIMFSRISTDREDVYVNEPFQLDLKIYVRSDKRIDERFGIQGGLPESGLDGELDWQQIGRTTQEELNGSIFTVYTFRATGKAVTAGTFTFSPEVQINLVIPRQKRRPYGFDDPFFGDFFGRQEVRPLILDCNPLDIQVKPIPMEGRPASFTGGVGVLGFDVDVSPTEIMAGEPVTVKMHLSGNGNLEKITPPSIEEQPGIKLYDVRTVPTDTPGEVCFEQVVIPTSDTVTAIPPIAFSYFNTQTADFRTITRGPFPITVEPAPHQAAQVMTSLPSANRKETKVLGHDIAYLKAQPDKWHTTGESSILSSPLFRGALIVPALLAAVTGIATGRRKRLATDVALARRQKAPKVARQNIQLAEQALKRSDTTAFYSAMWNAMAEYFGHRLNLSPGQVTLQTVRKQIPDETGAIEQLFNTIEQRRYGVRSDEDNEQTEMQTLLRQLTATLKQCERMKL